MFFRNIKKYIFLLFLFLFIILCFKNLMLVTVSAFAQNLSIRDNLLEDNNFSLKGTHDNATDLFFNLRKKNMIMLATLDIKQFVRKINLYRSHKFNNFNTEINILNSLNDLSFKNQRFRKESLIFIPRNIDNFWRLSCDTHMMPLLIPAISNIASIGSMPDLDLVSCFGHLQEYGYYKYYLNNKNFNKSQTYPSCEDLDNPKYLRILILKQLPNSSYQFKEINCIK